MITKLALFGIMLLMATPVVAQEQNLKDKLVISISNDFEPSRSWMSKVSGSLPGMGAGSGPKEKSGKGRHFTLRCLFEIGEERWESLFAY